MILLIVILFLRLLIRLSLLCLNLICDLETFLLLPLLRLQSLRLLIRLSLLLNLGLMLVILLHPQTAPETLERLLHLVALM